MQGLFGGEGGYRRGDMIYPEHIHYFDDRGDLMCPYCGEKFHLPVMPVQVNENQEWVNGNGEVIEEEEKGKV